MKTWESRLEVDTMIAGDGWKCLLGSKVDFRDLDVRSEVRESMPREVIEMRALLFLLYCNGTG